MKKWLAFAVAAIASVTAAFLQTKQPDVMGREGYWRVRNDAGVWWFISPDGKREFLTSVQTVQPQQLSRDPYGPHYQSKDKENWAEKTAARIKDYGFKSVGAWSDSSLGQYLPYTKDLNLIKWSMRGIGDPLWEADVELALSKQVKPLVADRNLIGYYTDNEIDWKANERHAPKYFEVTSRLLKKYDPNHLNLGVRFHTRPPLSVVRASVGKVDVYSVNQYLDTPQACKDTVKEIWETTRRPIIVSEFSYFAPDGMSGNKNVRWPSGGRVANRQQRAEFYERFVSGMAGTSFIVGCDWFQWNDEPPMGRYDGEDLNCGIVSIYDEPYPEMVDAVRRTTARVNAVHEKADSKLTSSAWRDVSD